jgi:hypothetical protein
MSDTDTRLQHVVLRWNIVKGHYFVGPFATAAEAATWAEEHQGTDICWTIELLDPAAPLKVRPPGVMPELEPDPEKPDRWVERQAAIGDFYLLMVNNDPLHFVGPFPDHRHAYSWGVAYGARTDDDGWQVVWEDPTAPTKLLTPAEGVAEAARSDAEFRRKLEAAGIYLRRCR